MLENPESSNDAIVNVQDLRKSYRSWSWGLRKEQEALRGVSLQAYSGEVFGLLGPNGAGKTTLIKVLLGVVKPTKGSASLFGMPVGSSHARQRVGYLPESLRVDRHHTARSALKYYGRMSGMESSDIARRSDELLELVGLTGRDRESVRRFSKGMYQRLGLAQALMHDPDLLVLDEPTDGLDPVGRNEVRQVIDRLRDDGKTIFLNSHILQEVELVCTRVAILAKGKIKAVGPIDTLGSDEKGNVVIHLMRTDLKTDDHQVNALRDLVVRATEYSTELIKIDGGNERWKLTIPPTEQRRIDALVDALRSDSYSIQSLDQPRASLEETFMRLLNEQDDHPETGNGAA